MGLFRSLFDVAERQRIGLIVSHQQHPEARARPTPRRHEFSLAQRGGADKFLEKRKKRNLASAALRKPRGTSNSQSDRARAGINPRPLFCFRKEKEAPLAPLFLSKRMCPSQFSVSTPKTNTHPLVFTKPF